MVHLIRSVNHRIIDVLIGQTEEVCYCYDQFLESSPYPFYNRQFQRILGSFFKEFSHRLIGYKSFYNGKDVVSQRGQGCYRNLRGKIVCLAFSESQQSLRLLEDDFQGPSLGCS